MTDSEDADTSYDGEDAVIIIPPTAYLRKSKNETIELAKLDEEQQLAFKEFRQRANELSETMQLDELKRAWIDDACLHRYLRAREFKVDEAFALLKGSLEWREEKKVWTMREDLEKELSTETKSGKGYRNGKDLTGRPIVIFRDRRQNSKDYVNQVNQVINTLERAIETMNLSDNVEQWVLLFDFKGYSMSNAPPMSTSRQVLDIFMNQYPERLGDAFFIDAPWLFSIFYKAISPFVPANTRAKAHFVSGNKEQKFKILGEYVDSKVLETFFGGENDCKYKHSSYWQFETKQHELFLKNEKKLLSEKENNSKATNSTRKTKTKKKKVRK